MKIKNNFISIVNEITDRDFQIEKCPDQIVRKNINKAGGVNFQNGSKDFPLRENLDYSKPPEGSNIILILESPHVAEYVPPLGPAKGTTGRNIRELLREVAGAAMRLKNRTEYNLILLNAIQHQCSLGVTTSAFRDKVFIKYWEEAGREEFNTRIKALIKDGDIVINACTAGTKKTKLRELVKAELDMLITGLDINLIEVEHPANWARERNWARKVNREANYRWKTRQSL